MELTHEFTVPASLDETWRAFNDIESVAGCFPGATVTSVEGDTFKGSCKVKLGPIALVYNGTGEFLDKDESAHTMKIDAKGKDKRGNGTAGANVAASMSETDSGTLVRVVTDLAITGKPAQFGRGVIQDVSDKLLAQFVDCLATQVGDSSAAEHAAAAEAAAADARAGHDVQDDLGAPGDGTPDGSAAAAPAAPAAAAAPAPRPAPRKESDDALDLGATVLPILVKSYGKQIAAGLVGLVLLIWLVRRIR